jgi:hypothetical protein
MTVKTLGIERNCLTQVRAACLLLTVLFAGTGVFGQTTGAIVGTVTDPSGSVLGAVRITVTNEGTNAIRSLTSDQLGLYRAELLPVGSYTVQAEHEGFKTTKITGIHVDVQQTVRTDILLQLGSLSEEVYVTSETPLLKTDAADVDAVISEKEVVELPLNGRNFLQLATLVPGTISNASTDGVLAGNGGGVQTNGADTNANNITLDGIENQDFLVPRIGIKLSPDAIAEFKVITANYSAEYGRAAGAVINAVTKSGTNQFHGDAFYFVRNDALDAHNYFDAPGSKLPPFHQNQFGVTFGGPIIKNKTFFFGSYEGFRLALGQTDKAILPTTAQENGDFSSGPAIFDPDTTQVVNGQIVRTQFPGNIIPVDRINPTALKALQLLFPAPQQQVPNVFNAIYNPSQTDSYNQYLVRIDHRLTDKDVIWGRFIRQYEPQLIPNLAGLASGFPGQGSVENVTVYNIALGYTRTFSSNVVNDMRFGFNRYVQFLSQQGIGTNFVGEIPLNGALQDPATWGQPNVYITGMSAAGTFQFSPSIPTTNTFQIADVLSFVKGAHNLKIGADVTRYQMNGEQFTNSRGVYFATGGFTQDPTNPGTTGQGLADFLLGDLSSASLNLGRTTSDLRGMNAGFFVQDNWNATRSLTLNLGLRYDYLPQPISASDRYVSYDGETGSMVTAQTNLNSVPLCAGCGTQTVAELEAAFAGSLNFQTRREAGLPRSLVRTDYNGWAPRVGFAWRMFGTKTVLRGGFGRAFEQPAGNIQWNYTGQAPYARSLAFSANTLSTPSLTIDNPFPSTNPIAAGAPGGFGVGPNWRNPHDDTWNLTLQREIKNGIVGEVGYVGARANNQPLYVNFNSPTFGIADIQTLRPNPNVGDTNVDESWGHSWYDSLQSRLRVQLKTLNISANYTWGHTITVGGGGINQNGTSAFVAWNFLGFRAPVNSGNLPASDPYLSIDKGPGAADVRQIFNFSYVWDLPFGKNRAVNLNGVVDRVLGGWELTGVTTFQSGFYLPISCAASCPRPNLLGNPNHGAPRTVQEWFNTSPALYQTPPSTLEAFNQGLNPAVTLGNAGRAPILGPPLQNWDLGIFKNFLITERFRFQFRAEMFNAFNHPYFGQSVNTSFGSATFGQISSAAPGREIQFGGKLFF